MIAIKSGDGDVKTPSIVVRYRIVDTEEKRPCSIYRAGFAGADKEESVGHNSD